jgi:hypothetical protein
VAVDQKVDPDTFLDEKTPGVFRPATAICRTKPRSSYVFKQMILRVAAKNTLSRHLRGFIGARLAFSRTGDDDVLSRH